MSARKIGWNEIEAIREKYKAGLSPDRLALIYKTSTNHVMSILTGQYRKPEPDDVVIKPTKPARKKSVTTTAPVTTTTPNITMSPKKVLIALPTEMMKAADARAAAEYRTRSDLIREALRSYLATPVKAPTQTQHYANVDSDFR